MKFRTSKSALLVVLSLIFLSIVSSCKRTERCVQKQVTKLLQEGKALSGFKRSMHMLHGLLKRCPGTPKVIQQYFKLHTAFASPLHPKVTVLSKVPKYWNRACPKFPVKRFSELDKLAAAEKEGYLKKHCGGNRKPLLTKEERKHRCDLLPPFVYRVMLYQWLLDTKVEPAVARRFMRHAYLSHYGTITQDGDFGGKTFPLVRSDSQLEVGHITTVEANLTELLVNGRKVASLAKGRISPHQKKEKKASSYLIIPLYKKLQEAAAIRMKLSTYNKSIRFDGKILLRILPNAPYRQLMEIMHTANEAGFKKIRLAVRGVNAMFGSCHRMIRAEFSLRNRPFQNSKKTKKK